MMLKLKQKILNKIDEMKLVGAMHVAASKCNEETFGSIKCINEGKDIVICGAGPTLQKYKPIEGVLHIALNRALLEKKVKFDWFIANDWDGVYFLKDELMNYDCEKFFGHQINGDLHRQIPESFRIACGAYRYYTDSYMKVDIWKTKFICDIDKMAISNMPNVALCAMQIALFTNPRRIYLVGCDASAGHFVQPKELGVKKMAQQDKDSKMAVSSDRVIEKWKELKEFADAFYPDTEIVSINPVGLKGIFKDEYQGWK